MTTYDMRQERSGEYYRYYSSQFPTVNGFGLTQEDAAKDFYKKLDEELNRIIRANERFPTPLTAQEIKERQDNFDGSYTMGMLKSSTTLTMYLHVAMMNQKVSRGELARILALDTEVKPDEWRLEKLRHITPIKSPKNKKVQRLLDVTHHSTIAEIYEALYVMDYGLDYLIKIRWAPDEDALKIG